MRLKCRKKRCEMEVKEESKIEGKGGAKEINKRTRKEMKIERKW